MNATLKIAVATWMTRRLWLSGERISCFNIQWNMKKFNIIAHIKFKCKVQRRICIHQCNRYKKGDECNCNWKHMQVTNATVVSTSNQMGTHSCIRIYYRGEHTWIGCTGQGGYKVSVITQTSSSMKHEQQILTETFQNQLNSTDPKWYRAHMNQCKYHTSKQMTVIQQCNANDIKAVKWRLETDYKDINECDRKQCNKDYQVQCKCNGKWSESST